MRKLVLILSVGATGAWAEVPKVAVDIAPVHSIVAAVMGDLGTPDLIVPPTASPHGYSLRPSEARALDAADVVIWMGHNLSPWLEDPIESLAGDATVIELLALPETQLLDVRDGVTFEAGDHDHEHGAAHDDHDDHDAAHEDHDDHDDHDAAHDDHDDHDDHDAAHGDHDDHGEDHADHEHDADHAEHDEEHAHDEHADDHADDHAEGHSEPVDPHAWLDPENARVWAGVIAQQMSSLDPENAETYATNAVEFAKTINFLEGEINVTLAPVRGRPFVVFHDGYHYFEHRFEIEAVGAVSSSDAVSPSAARVAELRDDLTKYGAVCALTEPQYNPAILEALGDVSLGEIDPLGVTLDLGSDLYGQLLGNVASSLAKCLK